MIDPFGTVYPCVQWRLPLGNVHDARLATIWRGAEAGSIRRQSKQVKRWIGVLPADDRPLQFCPGVAQELTGSVVGVHAGLEQRNTVFRKSERR